MRETTRGTSMVTGALCAAAVALGCGGHDPAASPDAGANAGADAASAAAAAAAGDAGGGADSGSDAGSPSADAGSPTGGSGGAGGSSASCDDDTVTLGATDYTEAPSSDDPTVCDAQIMAVHYDDLVATGPGYNLLLHYGWDAPAKAFGSFVTINLYGTAAGDYEIGLANGQADLVWSLPSGLCTASGGRLSIDAVGNIGGVIKGSLHVDGFAGAAGCPADGLDGSFTMTIVDSTSL